MTTAARTFATHLIAFQLSLPEQLVEHALDILHHVVVFHVGR